MVKAAVTFSPGNCDLLYVPLSKSPGPFMIVRLIRDLDSFLVWH